MQLNYNLKIACAIVAFFAATYIYAPAAEAEDFTVKYIDAADLKPVAAEVDTAHHATARARIGGTVSQILVSEGDEVKTGTVIAIIKDPKQPLAIDATQARLKSLEHQRSLAQRDAERYSKLAQSGVISKMKLDEVNTNLSVLDSEVKALQADLGGAVTQRDEGKVLAPMDGKVLTLPVTAGNVVMPGETIAELTAGDLVLKIKVPERNARYLKNGQNIRIISRHNDGTEAGVMHGTIQKIYPEVQDGRVTADVKVDNLEHLFVGERMTAYIPTANRKAIYIPPAMLIKRHGLNYVKLKSGEEVVIEIGLSDDNGVEVLSGLKEGDVLVSP